MKDKLYNIMQKIYGIGMMTSFFAGGLPIIPFVIAVVVGGEFGEKIAVFLYKQYYPCVIVLASVSVLFGLIAMYIGKQADFSLKTLTKKKEKD